MSILKTSLVALFFVSQVFSSLAQSEIKSYTYKKGQVFDIIFLITKSETQDQLQEYFKTVFPIAEKMGYNRQTGFSIKETPTQGNYHPQAMILGYWNDLTGRQKFLQQIEKVLPDFHKIRRDIWTTFDLTYYEVKEDISFKVNTGKFNVVTAHWQKEGQSLSKFKKEWLRKAKAAGGKIVVELEDGASPFGYYYNPDYLTITEWTDKATFDKFYKENLSMDHGSVQHVNQFIIQ